MIAVTLLLCLEFPLSRFVGEMSIFKQAREACLFRDDFLSLWMLSLDNERRRGKTTPESVRVLCTLNTTFFAQAVLTGEPLICHYSWPIAVTTLDTIPTATTPSR